jgi:hypothetical protein
MREVGHAACIGEMKNTYKILMRKHGKNYWGDLGIKVRIILK